MLTTESERGRTAPREQWLAIERIIDHWDFVRAQMTRQSTGFLASGRISGRLHGG